MGQYLLLRCEVPLDSADLAAFHLHEAGADGVEVLDEEVRPPAGVPARPEGKALVTGYFPGESDAEALKSQIESLLPGSIVDYELREEESWEESWRLHFQPLRVRDSFWVVPPWEKVPEGALSVVIEPGMAFGTGGHESTALCLDFLPDLLLAGSSVLDLGCGSGILGISAARLGAARVLMLDNDPVAVEVARKNAIANGLPEAEASGRPVEEISQTFDLILANILANPLIELAPSVVARMKEGAALVLSGITRDQAPEVREAYEELGLTFCEERTKGEWSALHLEKRG